MKSEKENIDSALLHMPPTCGKGTSHIQALTGALACLQNILSNDDRLSKKLPVELSDAINALKECIALSRQIKTHRVCGLSFIGQTYALSSNTKMFLLNKDTGWEAMLSQDELIVTGDGLEMTVAQAKRKEIHDMLDMWMDNNWEFKEEK